MNRSYYKSCIVPQCKSTNIKRPDKLFIYVPNNPQIRKKWLTLARRDGIHRLSPKTKMYFCEDHFDLPNDMLNYTQYHIMGKVSQVKMKSGCTPSKFECQEDRRKRTCSIVRPYMLKKQKMAIIEECLNKPDPQPHTSLDACEQDPLRKIIRQCRFCGETNKECVDVAYLPYLNKGKTSIVFNDISIQLDFSSKTLPNSVCDDCNVKLQEMRDFIILVHKAQEKFQVKTKSNRKKAKKTVTRNHTDDEDTNDPFENKRSIQNDKVDGNASPAFEGKDLQIEYEPTEPKEGSDGELEIKIEYESDNSDNKEEIADSLTIEEPVFFKETQNKNVDTAKRKAEVETEEFILDMNIKKEVDTDNTSEECPEVSASGVSASSSVDITTGGMTRTFSVEQGNKRKKRK